MFSGGCERKDIASINSVRNLGGFFGPTMVGWAKDYTGSFAAGLYALADFALLSAVVSVLGLRIANPAARQEIAAAAIRAAANLKS
jgi:ACS family tartrate transporter-like MFS transporter